MVTRQDVLKKMQSNREEIGYLEADIEDIEAKISWYNAENIKLKQIQSNNEEIEYLEASIEDIEAKISWYNSENVRLKKILKEIEDGE